MKFNAYFFWAKTFSLTFWFWLSIFILSHFTSLPQPHYITQISQMNQMSWHIFIAQKILPLLFHITLAALFESIYSSLFSCVKRSIRVWHIQKQQQSHLNLEISDQLVRVHLLFVFSLHHRICLEYRINKWVQYKKKCSVGKQDHFKSAF